MSWGKTLDGLIVPEELAQKREAWTKDEFKILRKMGQLMEEHKLDVLMKCKECAKLVEFQHGDGGLEMSCGCKRRVII